MSDTGDEEKTKPVDAEPALTIAYNRFLTTQQEANGLKDDSYAQQVIDYFKKKKNTRRFTLAEIYESFEDFEPPEHEYLKEELLKLMQLHEKQFEAARQVVEAVVNLHARVGQVDRQQCVYWGAGYDEFAENLGDMSWWRYIGGYGEQELTWVPKHWNIANDDASPPWIKEVPSIVDYNVLNEELPDMVPARSVDVGLFKTIGSVLIQDKKILNGFWDKIIRTMKHGSLLITTDPIPKDLEHSFTPYQPMVSALGTHELNLNASPAYETLRHGYVPRTFSCYSFVGTDKT